MTLAKTCWLFGLLASATTSGCGRGHSAVASFHEPPATDEDSGGAGPESSASVDGSVADASEPEDSGASNTPVANDEDSSVAAPPDDAAPPTDAALPSTDAADASEPDIALDAASAGSCQDATASNLDGVSLRFTSDRCRFTLGELERGVTFEYELTVARTLSGVFPFHDEAPCWGPQDDSGLALLELIEGDEQQYCRRCDLGRCRPINAASATETSPAPGTYAFSFTWFGHNFRGPADFGATEEMSPAFPPGEYVLRVTASGEWQEPGETSRSPFAVSAERVITVVEGL